MANLLAVTLTNKWLKPPHWSMSYAKYKSPTSLSSFSAPEKVHACSFTSCENHPSTFPSLVRNDSTITWKRWLVSYWWCPASRHMFPISTVHHCLAAGLTSPTSIINSAHIAPSILTRVILKNFVSLNTASFANDNEILLAHSPWFI